MAAKEKITYDKLKQDMDFFKPYIRYKGVWDMQDLYESMITYFRERKYHFYEKVYKHKHPSPFGVERQYVWEAKRLVDDIYLFTVSVYMHTYDAQDVEVKLKDGTTKVMTKGRIWIELGGHIEMYSEVDTDRFLDERWKKNRFWMNLKSFMNTYIIRKRHYEYWRDVVMYSEMQKLIWLIRRKLKMEYDEYEMKDWIGVHRSS